MLYLLLLTFVEFKLHLTGDALILEIPIKVHSCRSRRHPYGVLVPLGVLILTQQGIHMLVLAHVHLVELLKVEILVVGAVMSYNFHHLIDFLVIGPQFLLGHLEKASGRYRVLWNSRATIVLCHPGLLLVVLLFAAESPLLVCHDLSPSSL